MQLTAHRAAWSGTHAQNSLAAIRECYRERAERVEIDFRLVGGDFVVTHDMPRRGAGHPLLLRDALAIVRDSPGTTLLELDAKDLVPWPTVRALRLARLLDPVRHRVIVTSPADWNLRQLLRVDPSLALGFDPQFYLDWTPRPGALPGTRGAYGYLDAHPLARRRAVPTTEYLRERLDDLVRLVPGARELHLRLTLFERMLRDGLHGPAAFLHARGALVDVWTLDARTRAWRQRLERAVAAGVDVVTTNTPRELADAASALRHGS
ncbi:MAG: glycerophosphodiester phosphodiesterase [Chloroflexota bacterium]|nr:glycerophosphodiester phosphodiesterase [Chloroflexota bacterium]